MTLNTDVLIVGAGPTGLMMACQLLRFGIPFRVVDSNTERAKESRAFAVQAKSMEIFQNLGLSDKFLAQSVQGRNLHFYVNGNSKFQINFEHLDRQDTPFPSIFILPQSETEQILIEHLEKNQIKIERKTELVSFIEKGNYIEAEIKNPQGINEKITCRYIVGCDGAHSVVRHQLQIPFVGASYSQEFILADVSVDWPFPKDFSVFMSQQGFLVYIPLNTENNLSRFVIAGMDDNDHGIKNPTSQVQISPKEPPSLQAIEDFLKSIVKKEVHLSNSVWISRFYLHHRAVKQYLKGNAFLAGDAAHIHSPVGGQGMNTGLQDAANLAWKLALKLKYPTPNALLETYQLERQRIGEVLVNTTDKIFGFIIQKNIWLSFVRQYIMPPMVNLLSKYPKFTNRLFSFISELGIHYPNSICALENIKDADTSFLAGPKAGHRAPDAPVNQTSLFELFKTKPVQILIFQTQNQVQGIDISNLEKIHPELIAIHTFVKTPTLELLFNRYHVKDSAIYLIRPDGYIGYRAYGNNIEDLIDFLQHSLGLSIKDNR